jgi:hypothetical protein
MILSPRPTSLEDLKGTDFGTILQEASDLVEEE